MSINEQKILVVDDDPVVLKSLNDLLSIRGFNPSIAIGGQEAICQLDQNKYDLILLDLHMPYVSGHDVMNHINTNHIDTAVIIVSGETSFEAAKNACSQGAYDFLRKPYATDELVITINNALKEKRLQKQNSFMQQQLSESERLHRYIVNTSPDIIYILDHDGHFTFINERIESLLGFSKEEIVGKHYSFLVHHDDMEQAKYVFNERRIGTRAAKNIELRLKCKDDGKSRHFNNRTLPIELSAMGMYSVDNESIDGYTGTYGVARDVTERKIAEETINFQAYHDLLTKLPNRALLGDRLSQAINQAKRDDEKLAVMFLDLDRFKNINDSLGHMIGDELLQQVSIRLKECIRSADTLARFGGDEFTLLLPKLKNGKADASTLAEKIINTLKEAFYVDGHELYVSASIGIALYPQDGINMDTLIKHADVAMYHVKGQGKNGYQFYSTEMNVPYIEKLSMDTGIHKALDNNEFNLVYQPQINLRTGEIVGVEALLRWDHPEHGAVSPAEFVPFAEESGLIIDIGYWVIKSACAELNRWRTAGMPEIRMSINISARQLMEENIVKNIIRTIKDYDVPGRCLELEITEHAIMNDMDAVIRKLKKLSSHGITIAIDDFGTGYSSLSYLHKLPIQTLKIDRTFLRESKINKGDNTIISTIVSMAKGLSLNVIAEGVETQLQLEYLREIECSEAQGFLFGKPLPPDVISQLLIQEPYATPGSRSGTSKGTHWHH
ncbi:Sensory box/GGDEF family protein [hydrothermal vent metagenome]|uniref:Sensory box/GGDEF family protein n=1 Tax=hydrothermal vent metagenome TaxID=652676 RepID=A0A3B0XBY9_9ZZZZ